MKRLLAIVGMVLVAASCGGQSNATPQARSTQPTQVAATAAPTTQPPATPAPTTTPAVRSAYPLHTQVTATMFWVGEGATPDSGYISNAQSAWDDAWADHFGGIDDPNHRQGWRPAGFVPKQNPFYFALPYSDNIASNRPRIPWFKPAPAEQSLLKNRWIRVDLGGRSVYGQWEDVGPELDSDGDYVFGTAPAQNRVSGLDLSPAMNDYLGLGGLGTVSWQFVDQAQVPAGPWSQIITTSGTYWP